MKKTIVILSALFYFPLFSSAQTQQDTIYNNMTITPVNIDGVASEECWENAKWVDIDQVWIPYGEVMSEGDFEGRFKVSWDADFLYLLVDVVDNQLSDDYANPLENWYKDDCLEIFLDENRSKGEHRYTSNAFAYHVSQFYDAIDMSSSGAGINYKDHIEVVMTSPSENNYLWELAIKIYGDDYDNNNPAASRINLTPDKLMGLTLAYCDNDGFARRENFIGSMIMTEETANDNYITADYFGSMILVDPGLNQVGVESAIGVQWKISPIPSKDYLNIVSDNKDLSRKEVIIRNLTGQLIKAESFNDHSYKMDINELKAGVYLLTINSNDAQFSKTFIKQ